MTAPAFTVVDPIVERQFSTDDKDAALECLCFVVSENVGGVLALGQVLHTRDVLDGEGTECMAVYLKASVESEEGKLVAVLYGVTVAEHTAFMRERGVPPITKH
jgi:hypothetical protein